MGYVILISLFLGGCVNIRPSATVKKDLGKSSKPNYEAKIEVYKDIDLETIWKERGSEDEME